MLEDFRYSNLSCPTSLEKISLATRFIYSLHNVLSLFLIDAREEFQLKPYSACLSFQSATNICKGIIGQKESSINSTFQTF